MEINIYNIEPKSGLNLYKRISLLKEAFKMTTYAEANELYKKLENIYEYKTTEEDGQKIAFMNF